MFKCSFLQLQDQYKRHLKIPLEVFTSTTLTRPSLPFKKGQFGKKNCSNVLFTTGLKMLQENLSTGIGNGSGTTFVMARFKYSSYTVEVFAKYMHPEEIELNYSYENKQDHHYSG
ncbi:hypothetical protein TNCV_4706471 [Trichonephila clavipes]|nr:hypothetical protein TNCV_4706471 [Trichonephila clavipes]